MFDSFNCLKVTTTFLYRHTTVQGRRRPFVAGAPILVCDHVCGDQRSTLSVFLHGSLPWFSKQGLSQNLELLIKLDWLANKSQGSSCLCLSGAGLTCEHCHSTTARNLNSSSQDYMARALLPSAPLLPFPS